MEYIERETDVAIPLETLGFSVRSYNALRRAGILNYRDFMKLSEADLHDIYSLGEKSIKELTELRERFIEDPPVYKDPSDPERSLAEFEMFEYKGLYYRNLTIREMGLSSRCVTSLSGQRITHLAGLVDLSDQELSRLPNLGDKSVKEIREAVIKFTDPMIAVNFSSGEMAEKRDRVMEIHDKIYELLIDNAFTGISRDAIFTHLSPFYSETDIRLVLEKMTGSRQAEVERNIYMIVLPSFEDLLTDFPNQSQVDTFRRRLDGSTLIEIAKDMGLTRERVRQIELRVMGFIVKNGPVREEKYRYLIETYDIDATTFVKLTGESEKVYNYLCLRFKQHGTKPINEACHDRELPDSLRSRLDRCYGEYIICSGRIVKVTRTSIEDHLIETACIGDTSFDDFFAMYKRFIKKYGVENIKGVAAPEGSGRTFENYVSASRKVLWKQNKRFRYYDIDAGDFTELLDTLDLGQYKNVHYSSLKFFNMYPELMERYDIRDEYELHNLLRKLYSDKGNSYIRFNKMPMIEFGEFDRDAAMRSLLFSLAPISIDDLAEIMYREYGLRHTTVKSNWFSSISDYFVDGMYVTTSSPLPQEHFDRLKEVLTDDFYFISEIQAIYRELYHDPDIALISPFNLKKLGFVVNSTYVISERYGSARKYFTALLTERERQDITAIAKRFTGLVSFSDNLSKLKDSYAIIEYKPYNLISAKGYSKAGLSIRKIHKFCDRVYDFVEDGVYFTIELLRRQGFTSEIDNIGFDGWFYASLLREDRRFSYQKMDSTVLFVRGDAIINRALFIKTFVGEQKIIGVNKIRSGIRDVYSIYVSRWDIIAALEKYGYTYDSAEDEMVKQANDTDGESL